MEQNVLSVVVILCSFIAMGFGSHGKQDLDTSFDPQSITPEVAGKYAVYAMMSSNAYHYTDRVKYPIEKLGWVQVDLSGKPTDKPTKEGITGIAYDIFEKRSTDEVVFAFRGTDSKRDYLTANLAPWPFSLQYTQAKSAFGKYRKKHPQKKITVTGHSLGGGLALSMSVRFGINAVVFDSSPRIFDGLGDHHLQAERVLVYEGGEILEVVRKHWKKIFEAVKQEDIYKASFDFGNANKHRSDHLALGLMKLGSSANAELVAVQEALPN
jgi:dienelactone hydrolase